VPKPTAVNTQEKYLTVAEVAALLRLDRHVVTGMFAGESGVVVLGNAETVRGCRKYRQLRIPQSVLNRVVARNTVR
jgi:hypothetical protein